MATRTFHHIPARVESRPVRVKPASVEAVITSTPVNTGVGAAFKAALRGHRS